MAAKCCWSTILPGFSTTSLVKTRAARARHERGRGRLSPAAAAALPAWRDPGGRGRKTADILAVLIALKIASMVDIALVGIFGVAWVITVCADARLQDVRGCR